MHMMAEEKIPSCMNIPEINTNIILPNAKENRESVGAQDIRYNFDNMIYRYEID
jgi:hypothetical protein